MNDDQRAADARCNEIRADDRLADTRWRHEYAGVVPKKSASRRFLNGGELSLEANTESRSGYAFVDQVERDTMHPQ